MEESEIFSKQFKYEDILQIVNFQENSKSKDITEGYDYEIDEKKLDFEEFWDTFALFSSLFKQEEIDKLKNNYQLLLYYFYSRELQIEEYITSKYKLNNNKRILNLRFLDYLIRIEFETNEAIYEDAKLINEFISEINDSYYKKENLDDLSDQTYINKISIVLGTKKIPKFLLREGFRLRREIEKNKEIYVKNAEEENELENKKESFTNINNGKFNNNDEQIIINNEEWIILDDITNISSEIENKRKIPFARTLNEVYIILFFLILKEINNYNLYDELKINLKTFINYFQIETYITYEEFKKNYIDSSDKISNEIIYLELSEINELESRCKYIIASYKVLINKIFTDPIFVYIYLLLFLLNYIPKENELFRKVIENELNSFLTLIKNKNQIYFNQKIIAILKKFNFEPKSINQENYGQKKKNQNNYPEKNCIIQQNNIQNQNNNKTQQNYMDFNYINNFMQQNNLLKNRFNEIVKEEELYEEGSFSLKYNIIGQLKKIFKIIEIKNTDTIRNYLKIIPYNKEQFEERPILILISGYLSSKDDQFKEWEQLINAYKKKFNNPNIYFYNWPASKFSFKKLIFHRKDFRDTRKRAKYCGKMLALIIMSGIFKGCKINLSAFSLGNHVLKHCLKELKEYNKLDLINNVVFMAGATNIKCIPKWEEILGSVTGTIVNCYSDNDLALWYCKIITEKDTIGSKELKFPKVKVINRIISSFHTLYRVNMENLWKMFISDLKE